MTARFDETTAVIVGRWNDGEGAGFQVGTLIPYSDTETPVYRASHEGGRIDDYRDVPGESARMTREAGYLSAVAAPITVSGRTWGALFVFSVHARHSPRTGDRGQTMLVAEQRGLPLDLIWAYGAGLQIHVEDLAAYIAGRERGDAGTRFAELEPAYRDLAAGVS